MFDLHDAAGVMQEVQSVPACDIPNGISASMHSIRPRGFETVRLSFIVQRPAEEARYRLVRAEGGGPQHPLHAGAGHDRPARIAGRGSTSAR